MIPFLAPAQAERLALKEKLGLALRHDPLRLTAAPELHPLPSRSGNGSDGAASMMQQQPCPSPIRLDSWDMMMEPAVMADLGTAADASCAPAPEEPCLPSGVRADLAAADDGALLCCSANGSKILCQLLFCYQAPFPPLRPKPYPLPPLPNRCTAHGHAAARPSAHLGKPQ